MKKLLLLFLLLPSTLLLAGDFGTIFMSATLFVLLLTLIIALVAYLKRLQKESLKNSALFDYSDVPTLFINAKGTIVELNQSAQTLLGYSKKQLASQKWYEKLLPNESSIQIRHQIHQTLKEDARSTFTSYLTRANGQLLEINYTLSALPEPFKGSILTLVDVTKSEALREELMSVQEHLNETKTALEHLSEQFKVTFDIAINGIALLDDKGDMIYLNRALTEMFEYNEDYMKHLGIRLLVDGDESVQLLLNTAKRGEKIEKMHIRSQTRSGKALDIDLTMGYLPEIKQYYLVAQDITKTLAYTTELQQTQKTLEQRVITDSLTSAYNRAYMEESLEHLMLIENETFGFIILDIDHFKNVNDTYGHLVGDDVLIHLVKAIREKLRRGDILARFGGEEFAIILPNASHEESLKIAQKLQEQVASLHFENCPKVTCSFGVASFDGTQDKRNLLLSADRALYRAKESGRNCVVDARSLSDSDYTI
ncbi:MAG: sensor domain-containing diguanylate cyclase [Sulfurimonadaceae bacterium]